MIARSTAGPILTINDGQIGLENLEVSGATTNGSSQGAGIYCAALGGAPSVDLYDVLVRNNAADGLETHKCAVTASQSTFESNGKAAQGSGIDIIDGTGVIDRCIVRDNAIGMNLDSGLYQVTNSFIYRNDGTGVSYGISLFSTASGNRIEFNTIADNAKSSPSGIGFNCGLSNVTASFPNNIIVRNRVQAAGPNCTYPSSIILDTDVSGIKFVSPDSAPYDYHIGAGSIAVDAATASNVDHDFDGQPRTSPRDVGADEYYP